MASSGSSRRRSKNHSREASLDITFENTVQNKSLQPCDLNGFMDYLFYVERRAENLQFFLWYCDYVERWSRLLPQQRQMAPAWGPNEAAEAAQEDAEAAAAATAPAVGMPTLPDASIDPPPPTASIHGRRQASHRRGPSASSNRNRQNLSIDTSSTGFPHGNGIGPFKARSNSIASTATAASVSSMASVSSHLSTSSRLAASIHQRADNDKLTNILTILENLPEAPEGAPETPIPTQTIPKAGGISPFMVSPRGGAATPSDWQLQPYTLQPFSDELGRIVRHYIAATGDRPLPDLFPPERAACLRAARRTTHPSALLPAFLAAEAALREQSFPAFVQAWCIGNVAKGSPRLILVQILATVVLFLGLALDVILIVLVSGDASSSGMMWTGSCLPRLACLVFWWPALTVLLAAWRKIDLLLHMRGRRLLRSWEIEDEEEGYGGEAGSPLSTFSVDIEKELAVEGSSRTPRRHHDYQRGHRHQTSTSSTSSRIDPLRKASLQALGPRNDPDSEPWAVRQKQTPLYRRLLAELWPKNASLSLGSRTVAVQHAGVRAMQARAVWAAMLWAGLASTALTVGSLFIPGPRM